jgi:hypothetical protein
MEQVKSFKQKLSFLKIVEFSLLLTAHLALLKWIWYVLEEGGLMPMDEMFWHFLGLSLSGAGLIFICAMIGKARYKREILKGRKS